MIKKSARIMKCRSVLLLIIVRWRRYGIMSPHAVNAIVLFYHASSDASHCLYRNNYPSGFISNGSARILHGAALDVVE